MNSPTSQDLIAIGIGTAVGAFFFRGNRVLGAVGGGALGYGVSYAIAQQQLTQTRTAISSGQPLTPQQRTILESNPWLFPDPNTYPNQPQGA